ncbi:MAG: hypothetical protein LBF01_00325 [Bacteroidales bacterium]|jgi:F0F1-type ATP synthase membrane subunit c/vacuolar-type H+-ATPase subunit K|nr:hypothetical protein [Bacteroidales bacterium]
MYLKKIFFIFCVLLVANIKAQESDANTLNIKSDTAAEPVLTVKPVASATESSPILETEPSALLKEMPYLLNTKRMTKENLRIIQKYQPNLYNDYIYLKSKYSRTKKAGWIALGVGLAGFTSSVTIQTVVALFEFIFIGKANDHSDVFFSNGYMRASVAIGLAGASAGIPLIVTGTKRSKRLNRNTMEEYNLNISVPYHSNVIFSAGATSNGAGLLVTF